MQNCGIKMMFLMNKKVCGVPNIALGSKKSTKILPGWINNYDKIIMYGWRCEYRRRKGVEGVRWLIQRFCPRTCSPRCGWGYSPRVHQARIPRTHISRGTAEQGYSSYKMRARLVVDKGTVIVSWGYVWCKIRVRVLFDCEGMDNLWWGYDSCILGVRLMYDECMFVLCRLRLVDQLDGQSIIISFKGGKLLFKTSPIGALFIIDYESSRNKKKPGSY